MTALPSVAVIPEANRLAGKPIAYEMADFVPLARMFGDPMILAVNPIADTDRLLTVVRRIGLS